MPFCKFVTEEDSNFGRERLRRARIVRCLAAKHRTADHKSKAIDNVGRMEDYGGSE